MRLLDDSLTLAEKEAFELTPTRVVHTPEVTHIRCTVNGRADWCSTTAEAERAAYPRGPRTARGSMVGIRLPGGEGLPRPGRVPVQVVLARREGWTW